MGEHAMRRPARALLLVAGFAALAPARQPTSAGAAQPASGRAGTVVLAGAMPEPDLIALSVMSAGAQPDADFLLDTPRAEAVVKPFLDRLRPAAVAPVGS